MHVNPFILQLNLLAIVVLLTIVCGLLIRKNNVKANIFLAFLVLYAPLSIALNVIFIILHQHQFLFLAPLNIGVNLTFGPILLCYISLIQGKNITAILRNFFHFIPSLVISLSSTYYILIPEKEKMHRLNDLISGKENYINAINLCLLLHIGFYLYISWKKIIYYKHTATDLSVFESERSVKWQQAFLQCIIAVNLLLLMAYALPIIITGNAHVYSDLIAAPVVAIGMYLFMIYKGLSYHVIFDTLAYQKFKDSVSPINHFMEKVEIQKKPPGQPMFENEIKEKLDQLFHSEKIHTRPSFKLHDMALLLNMSPAVLSATINSELKMTFFEMLNQHRVEEAKKLLIKPENRSYKIEYIGEMSGFNSRASFFSVFKKHVGKTPLAYRDEHMK